MTMKTETEIRAKFKSLMERSDEILAQLPQGDTDKRSQLLEEQAKILAEAKALLWVVY